MKFQMAKNSMFAVLLRSPWWISIGIAVAVGLVAAALLPAQFKGAGALSGLPFAVIGVLAARRQWHLPSAADVAATQQAVSALGWPAFAKLLEQAFVRDGYAMQPGTAPGVDFVLERQGRRMLVAARRWKSARTGLEALRPLQAAREDGQPGEGADALYIGLGALSESAVAFAATHRIAVWQAGELAHALRKLPLR